MEILQNFSVSIRPCLENYLYLKVKTISCHWDVFISRTFFWRKYCQWPRHIYSDVSYWFLKLLNDIIVWVRILLFGPILLHSPLEKYGTKTFSFLHFLPQGHFYYDPDIFDSDISYRLVKLLNDIIVWVRILLFGPFLLQNVSDGWFGGRRSTPSLFFFKSSTYSLGHGHWLPQCVEQKSNKHQENMRNTVTASK